MMNLSSDAKQRTNIDVQLFGDPDGEAITSSKPLTTDGTEVHRDENVKTSPSPDPNPIPTPQKDAIDDANRLETTLQSEGPFKTDKAHQPELTSTANETVDSSVSLSLERHPHVSSHDPKDFAFLIEQLNVWPEQPENIKRIIAKYHGYDAVDSFEVYFKNLQVILADEICNFSESDDWKRWSSMSQDEKRIISVNLGHERVDLFTTHVKNISDLDSQSRTQVQIFDIIYGYCSGGISSPIDELDFNDDSATYIHDGKMFRLNLTKSKSVDFKEYMKHFHCLERVNERDKRGDMDKMIFQTTMNRWALEQVRLH